MLNKTDLLDVHLDWTQKILIGFNCRKIALMLLDYHFFCLHFYCLLE